MRRFDSIDHLSLNVQDVHRSYEFYTNFIGLNGESVNEWAGQVTAGSSVCMLLRGDPSPSGVHFGFREATRGAVDEWFRKAKEAGVRIDHEPAVQRWGGYELGIRDPDGYEIQIWTDSDE